MAHKGPKDDEIPLTDLVRVAKQVRLPILAPLHNGAHFGGSEADPAKFYIRSYKQIATLPIGGKGHFQK